jgi:hypothetical protein
MSAAKLFRNWLALREAEHCRGQDDEEVERLTDEMIAIERAILARDPETPEDERAQVAMLAYYAVHEAPYANYEVMDRCYRRLVIDRLSDPIARKREREWGRKRKGGRERSFPKPTSRLRTEEPRWRRRGFSLLVLRTPSYDRVRPCGLLRSRISRHLLPRAAGTAGRHLRLFVREMAGVRVIAAAIPVVEWAA